MRSRVAIGVSCVLLLAAVMAACSKRDDGSEPPGGPSTPEATPTPVTLTVTIEGPAEAHQGYVAEMTVHVRRLELPAAATIEVDYGDGQRESVPVDSAGSATLAHTYLAPGTFDVKVSAIAPGLSPGSASEPVLVHPRRIVFVQGMNSSSSCPDGGGFRSRAPEWLIAHLTDPANVGGMVFEEDQFVYYSYSGRWCSGGNGADGSPADYRAADTCDSIDGGYGEALRDLIDRSGPGRVTVVAHSMGGLIAAYAVGSDPEWARTHVASVATFDSPLGGVNVFRASVLGAGGVFDSDCGLGSDAVRDLDEGSGVVKAARGAAKAVPFYTSDATEGEEIALRRMEAVPESDTGLDGDVLRTHFDDDHSDTWTQEGQDLARKQRFVVCAVAIARQDCLPD